MKTTLWKLKNTIKNFDWGSLDGIPKYFHIDNSEHKPMAEMWMGIHPSGVSTAINAQGVEEPLDQLINRYPNKILGAKTYQQFKSLPFLFKILSAKEPLSIQVHPELYKAKAGFARENQLGIPINSPNRNYKDPNHKPELIYAITPFLAMNGFRPIAEILALFNQLSIPIIEQHILTLAANPSELGLKRFFHSLLTLEGAIKQQAISALLTSIKSLPEPPFNYIPPISQKYPSDCGVFAPLILNIIELLPGQAMFLNAQTPHAYLRGTGLEIMANSDNVLRAGLTNKHIDIEELFNNTSFTSIPSTQLLTQPRQQENKTLFPVSIDDFAFEIIHSQQQRLVQSISSAQIILCVEGEIEINTESDRCKLKVGESVFIACCAKRFTYQGSGVFARAFNH